MASASMAWPDPEDQAMVGGRPGMGERVLPIDADYDRPPVA